MENISLITTTGFLATVAITLWLFYRASSSGKITMAIIVWMTIVAVLGITGFYRVEDSIPPRFLFLLFPGLLFTLFVFSTRKGRSFSDELSLKWLTLLHVIRIPVELVLYGVYLGGLIPDLMTFDGHNYDILSGISAPLVYYAVFVRNWMGRKALLVWNFACLALLINILTIAVLSAQTPIQQLAFDQPNIGVTYFPFVWLPAVIVPIVFYAHLATIRQLIRNETIKSYQ
jgi:hypothetical protein